MYRTVSSRPFLARSLLEVMPREVFEARKLTDPDSRVLWIEDSPISGDYETRLGTISVRHGKFSGGSSDAVEVITIDSGTVRVWVLPTRGMGVWRMDSSGIQFGWDSPVAGPIHPHRVPIDRADGLGWLEGFDELVVRCGLESNGAPQFDDHKHLQFPLHGRIANLPAESLSLEVDVAKGTVELRGTVIESMLFFKRLRMECRIRMTAGSSEVEILDDVTNDFSRPATMQLLYHINVGAPLLSDASRVELSAETVAPKDALSANTMSAWNQGQSPTSGQTERVYFTRPRVGSDGRALAMLVDRERELAIGVSYNAKELPYFVVWKNTAATQDGYVTGLEPATGLPNTRQFESDQGRLVTLEPGETRSYRLTVSAMTTAESVASFSERLQTINEGHEAEVLSSPKPGWSPGA